MEHNEKVCIITGANSGIGYEAAKQIARAGHHVILACRSSERGEAALAEIRAESPGCSAEFVQVDLGLPDSVREFCATVKRDHDAVDVLIHNAALFDLSQKEAQKTASGVESIWSVNHLGPVLMTELLLGHLQESGDGRVITISSQGLVAMPRLQVDLEDPEFARRKFSVSKAYYQSKRAQVMYTLWLADRLDGTGVTANSIRVTAVKVDLARHPNLSALKRWAYAAKSRMSISPAEMASTYTWLATSEDVRGMTGKYFNEKKAQVRPAPYSADRRNITAVMELTATYVPELREVIARGSATAN